MAEPVPSVPDATPGNDEIAFDYIKTNDFRSVLVDGALGAVSPNGRIHIALYVERTPIPKRQIFTLDSKTGELSSSPTREIDRGAIVREMSCDLHLDPDTARELALLLLRLVAKGEEPREDPNEEVKNA